MGYLTGLSLTLALLATQPVTQDGTATPQVAPAQKVQQDAVPLEPTAAPYTDPVPDADLSLLEQTPQPLAFADKTDDELVAMAKDWLESVGTLNGTFIQQAPSGSTSSGAFYIRRPGLLRFEYEPPSPLLIIANGGTVFVRDEALKTTDSYPVGRTPLKFLLRRKIDLDVADIKGVERGPDAFAIAIAARDEETQGELNLVFSAPDVELVRWIVRDARNGLTIVDLFEVEKDKRLDNNLFRIPETQSPFLKN